MQMQATTGSPEPASVSRKTRTARRPWRNPGPGHDRGIRRGADRHLTTAKPDTMDIEIVDASAPPSRAPGPPRSVMADGRAGRVTLTWNAPSDPGRPALSSYEYQYALETASYPATWTTVPGGSGARSVVIGDLTAGERYKVPGARAEQFGAGSGCRGCCDAGGGCRS